MNQNENTAHAASPLASFATPAQEMDLLRDRVLIITGVGRSGTTILGKIIGSMRPAHYLFEPAAMKYLTFLCRTGGVQAGIYAEMARSLLTEDYLLPLAQGRNLNFNAREDSYIGHYMPNEEVGRRWKNLSRRQEIVAFLKEELALWVIKSTEHQALFRETRRIFPGARFLHVLRDGNDVVSSALKRGWYTDAYMSHAIIDWVQKPPVDGHCPAPWYIDDESKALFGQWNQATRAACVWRCLTQIGLEQHLTLPREYRQIRYEELVARPGKLAEDLAEAYGLTPTPLTAVHLEAIREHRPSAHPSIVGQIQQPERDRFAALMDELGYRAE